MPSRRARSVADFRGHRQHPPQAQRRLGILLQFEQRSQLSPDRVDIERLALPRDDCADIEPIAFAAGERLGDGSDLLTADQQRLPIPDVVAGGARSMHRSFEEHRPQRDIERHA
jgi:hypothetical protein